MRLNINEEDEVRYKFDDERVTKEDPKRVLEEQYGGEEETNPGFNNTTFNKYSNAYVLVYIREVDKEKVICNVDEKDIAEHLYNVQIIERLNKEHKKKEKEEPRLYTSIKVARDEDLGEQIGKDIYFDCVDHNKVRSFQPKPGMSEIRKSTAVVRLMDFIQEDQHPDLQVEAVKVLGIIANMTNQHAQCFKNRTELGTRRVTGLV
ncbi:ubiquitin-specific protease [Trifolium repens]|nr:ubiquitin-specific protease [Trifolium repens]